MAFAATAAGSLAPDLDHPFSKASFGIPTALLGYGLGFLVVAGIQRRSTSPQIFDLSLLGDGYFAAARLAVAVGLILLISSFVFGLLFKHRGPVHSLAFGFGITAVFTIGLALLGAPLWLWAPFSWGWVAHLLADATTPHGVPFILWPLGSGSADFPLPASRPPLPARLPRPSQAPTGQRVIATRPDLHTGESVAPAGPTRSDPRSVVSRPHCPKCGVPMVLRTAKRGSHAGNTFYGCVNFPRCRQTRPVDRPGGSGLTRASS